MVIEYKVRKTDENNNWHVVKLYLKGVEEYEMKVDKEEIVFTGSISDCESYIRLKALDKILD